MTGLVDRRSWVSERLDSVYVAAMPTAAIFRALDRRVRHITLAVAVSLALAACGDAPPNVVLITLDGTRADHLGIYGYETAQTPNFDRFARNAVLYDRAYSTSSSTLASHGSLMTGLLPMQHGARARLAVDSQKPSSSMRPLFDPLTTLAEHLRAAGYHTAAVVANPELRRELGVAQGFEQYDDTLAESAPTAGRPAEVIADLAMDRVAAFGEQSFFLFVDFFDPHSAVLAEYDATIAVLDVHLGRLLSALDASPRADKTLIAITSDHGGRFGKRGDVSHGPHLYEEAVRVPLAIRYPGGLESGTRIATPTQNYRLFATFLEQAGAVPAEEVRLQPLGGRDMLIFTEVRRTASEVQRVGDVVHRDMRALYMFPFKLIQTSTGLSELYDLDRDPDETHNIVSEAPKAYSRLLKLLGQYAQTRPPLYDDEHDSNVWPATIVTLEALGTVE